MLLNAFITYIAKVQSIMLRYFTVINNNKASSLVSRLQLQEMFFHRKVIFIMQCEGKSFEVVIKDYTYRLQEGNYDEQHRHSNHPDALSTLM